MKFPWNRSTPASGQGKQSSDAAVIEQMLTIHQGFDSKTPQDLYQDLLEYAELVYPREASRNIAVENLNELAKFHWNRQEYAQVAKLFRGSA